MKTIRWIWTVLMAIVLFSCSRQEEDFQDRANELELVFTAEWAKESSQDTRTVLQEDGTSVWWSAGEEINVFFGDIASGKFVSTNTDAQPTVSFKGSISGLTGDEGVSPQTSFWAVYPYHAYNSCDGESLTLTVSQNQNGQSGTFADKSFPAVAKSDNYNFAFYNVCGGARFSVTTEGIEKIVFKSVDGSPMSGTARVAVAADGKPEILDISDAKDSVVVNAPVGGFVPEAYYFASMLPQKHEQGLALTFYTSTKRATKSIDKSITVHRSAFGKLDRVDEGISNWEDYTQESGSGGTRSGLYLGIIGFNDQLYEMPIGRLDGSTFSSFTSFIDNLSTRNATLLYYSVDESIRALSLAHYPDNLFSVSLVTFTDGLDQGSSMMIEDYPGDAEYLNLLSEKISETRVEGIPLTAYSVGIRGNDVSDVTQFQNNLRLLAFPSYNSFEVNDMETVNRRFQGIADQVNQTLTGYSYDLDLTIPGQANGTLMRFTLDNVYSATASKLYIEGVFDLSTRTLTEVSYHGLTAENGDTVEGEVNGVYVHFPFRGIVVGDGKSDSLNKSNIRHWTYVSSTGNWQQNSEFNAANDASMNVTRIKKSAVVLLNLDCSTSLANSFGTLKNYAKSFVESLYNTSYDPSEVSGVSLDKTSLNLFVGGKNALLTATVSPSTASIKDVTWSSSNTSVATVDANGVVTGIGEGSAQITVTTEDRGFTASCEVTVELLPVPEAVDLGLSVLWSSFNLGASSLEEYGEYYAWGETAPKDDYKWSTYKWCNGSLSTLTKYNTDSSYGTVDNKTVLDPDDDVAHIALGGNWRMPTEAEWTELRENCIWTRRTMNGVRGVKVSGKMDGYTDNWIFLPYAGKRYGIYIGNVGSDSYYWSSSIKVENPNYAWMEYFYYDSENVFRSSNYRYDGHSVRSVTVIRSVSGISIDKTNINLFEGGHATLTTIVYPSTAAIKDVTWSSSNTSVVTVDANGVLTGIHEGIAQITATTVDGGFTASCEVTVSPAPVYEPFVDFGLSVMWANWNLGASSPEEYGDYYAWGETETKSEYSWSTYKWCNGSYSTMTKYCNNTSYGKYDGKTVLVPEDDAAHISLGGNWRMPTNEEWGELIDNCTWSWTTMNGVYGIKITSNKEGYTDKWMFLPAAGYRRGASLEMTGSYGNYWSSSLTTDAYPYYAWYATFDSSMFIKSRYGGRDEGKSIRPVWETPIPVTGITLNRTVASIAVGHSMSLIATVTPADATINKVVWSSSDTSIATVDNEGQITAVAAGTATITARTVGRGYTASCALKVVEKAASDAVDLGLSVNWASFNLGASAPEGYGNYYAWGETEPKDRYDWTTYTWYDDTYSLTKYNTLSNCGTVDNKTVLDPEDDAAHVILGGSWRMPTEEEWTELLNNCTCIWATVNDVRGFLVTSNVIGYTDKSIFLPAGGSHHNSYKDPVGKTGFYLSSSLTENPRCAWSMSFGDWDTTMSLCDRSDFGCSIRPVTE